MNFEKYANKGLSGLSNLGNTCFINSCMQVISHIYELNDFLEEGNYKKKLNTKIDSALLLEWDNLRKLLWSENCVVSPNKFLKTIQKISQVKGNDIFSGYAQNDVCEFLLFLIDCFHTSLSREINMTIMGNSENETDNIAVKCYEMIKKMYSKEYSEIWNLFYAIHVSEIIDLETSKTLSIRPEPFFMIDLPIPKNVKTPSLLDCFDLYVEGETLEGENAWFNEETNTKQSVKKKISFWSFPKILVIDLKRFNKNVQHFQKNQKLRIKIWMC
jgi:ubiquitin C-terminal hydrolase